MAFTLPERERAAVRKQRYDACFILPVAEVDKGTSYPCTKRALALLTDEKLPVLSPPDIVPASTATSTLEEALGPVFSSCPEAVAALQRFRVNGLNPQEWGPDLMFKVFGDLDRAFFMGKLKNRVILKWNNDRRFRHQGLVGVFDTRWGLAVCTDMRGISKKAWIYLNANKLLLPHYIQLGHIWSVLLHEMLHVYLNLRTGLCPEEPKYRRYDCTHLYPHGPNFERCWKAIRSRFPGDLPDPPEDE